MRNYFLYSSRDAYQEGKHDASCGFREKSWEYDRYSDSERDQAYYEGYRDEENRQERLREERRQQEECEERQAYRRQIERQQEEEMMFYQYCQCDQEPYYEYPEPDYGCSDENEVK